MKHTIRTLESRRESARRQVEGHRQTFESGLRRMADALECGVEVDVTFLQHTSMFAEAAGQLNAFSLALEMIEAETEGD